MFLPRVRLFLCGKLLKRTDDTEAGVARLDHVIYITVACHKEFMKLNCKTFKGMIGNRRDNLSRYIDKLFNGKSIMGIGALRLKSVRSVAPATGFTGRELCYEIRDFNIVEEIE